MAAPAPPFWPPSFPAPNATAPPAPPQPSDGIIDPVIAANTFAVVTSLVGLVLIFFGHKFFKLFLGMTTFIIVAGAIGYMLLFSAKNSLPWWGSSLIACGMGLGAGVMASYAVTLGLVVCAAIAGAVIAALPMRVFAPETPGALRFSLILVAAALGAASTLYTVFKCRTPDDEDEDSMIPMTASQRRQKRRAIYVRNVLTAVVTSVMGAYFVVHAANQWWHGDAHSHSWQAAALLDPGATLPACGTPCIGLGSLSVSLVIVGLLAQLRTLCRKPPPGSELSELHEPMAPAPDRSAATVGARRGCQSELAQRMRFKYCGGRAASSVPAHTATSVTSASSFERAGILPAGNEARPRANRQGSTAPLTGPSWERSALPSADPWANMGVAPPSQAAPTAGPSSSQGSADGAAAQGPPPPAPAGAQWPPANPVWPPRDEE